MSKIVILEFNLGKGHEIKVFADYLYAVRYARELMDVDDGIGDGDMSKEGLRVLHVDSHVGESVVYETEITETPSPECTQPNVLPKRKIRIRK